ncbi:MAG: 30S ribosome-binding factor RbfA [Puniceicoccaceae bacterium]
MPKRVTRVNELIKREISTILHTDYRAETVAITIIDVDVSPDLRNGNVYYSVIGDQTARNNAASFFRRHRGEIRRKVGNQVILKYLPEFRFIYDEAIARGANVLDILDALEDAENEPTS